MLMNNLFGTSVFFCENFKILSTSLWWNLTWWCVGDLNCNGIVGKLNYKNGVNYFLVYVIFVNRVSSEVMFMEKKSESV